MRQSAEATKALLPLLVLDALAHGELNGAGIMRRIRDATRSGIEAADGTVYPLLYRLEAQRRIRGRWLEQAGMRRQRVYAITPGGSSILAEQREQWRAIIAALAPLLDSRDGCA
jgi:PadR family transcriptional regulator PadR